MEACKARGFTDSQDLRLRRAARGAGAVRDGSSPAPSSSSRASRAARPCTIAVAFARDGKKPAEALVLLTPDRDHQGQPRQGRAHRRDEVTARGAGPPRAAPPCREDMPGHPLRRRGRPWIPRPWQHATVRAPAADRRARQALPRRHGPRRRVASTCAPGEVLRPARRERRRQVDAAEDPLRRPAARLRHASYSTGEPSASPARSEAQALRHRHDLPGVQPRPDASVAENIFIGREPLHSAGFVDWRAHARATTRAITARVGLDIDPDAPVSALSVAEQQMVEIARALSMDAAARSSWTSPPRRSPTRRSSASSRIVRTVCGARASRSCSSPTGSRRRWQICDRVTVLRDGRLAGARRDGRLDHPDASSTDGRPRGSNALSRAAASAAPGGDVRARRRGPRPRPRRRGAARHHAARHRPRGARRARSWASPASSAPAAPSSPARSSAPTRSPPARVPLDGAAVASARRATPSAAASAWCRRTASSRRCSCRWPSARTSPSPRSDRLDRPRSASCDEREGARAARAIPQALHDPHGRARPARRNLSGGNQQKVVLARWLALRARRC